MGVRHRGFSVRRSIILAFALAMLAGCDPRAPRDPVTQAWIRLPAVEGRPAAAYFTLNGKDIEDTLIAVESPMARRVELHESSEQDGRITMTPIETVVVSANDAVLFEPGGKHAMLFDVDPRIGPGARLTLDFRFDSGRDVRLDVPTVAAGQSSPY